MSTFGVIISNRSFFPDHLARTAREKLMAAMEQWGHQVIALSPEDTFLGQTYTVTPEFDRMGCRLDGPVIQHVESGDIISDGISFGAIQVPAAGKPIIMLCDRQTTGGYTKIATVISADFRLLAQLKAGDKLRFQRVTIQHAQDALLTQRAALRALRSSVGM